MKIARKNHEIKIFLNNFYLNRNLQRIPFKVMYNMSMLCHRSSNKQWGGGGGGEGTLNHLPLLFYKNLYLYSTCMTKHPSGKSRILDIYLVVTLRALVLDVLSTRSGTKL